MAKTVERAIEVLKDLESFSHRDAAEHPEWARPMDVGGRSGTYHSATLDYLFRRGLVERRQRSALNTSRGSWMYRITDAGRAALHLLAFLDKPTHVVVVFSAHRHRVAK
jgi:hypothetical protein